VVAGTVSAREQIAIVESKHDACYRPVIALSWNMQIAIVHSAS
jgi:hypothetical protein